MSISITQLPLKIENYFFTDTEIHYAPLENESEPYKVSKNIGVSTQITENGAKKSIEVTVQSDSKDSDGKPYNLSFKISVLGNFINTSPEEETEEIKKMIYANAVSILIGVLREYLMTLTAKGPFAAYILPTLCVSVKKEKQKN